MKRLAILRWILLICSGIILISELQSCKHDAITINGQDLPITAPTTTPSLDGASLYTVNCASCHGPLATSAKLGVSATLIQTGITTISNMNSLAFLTVGQVQAIATALATNTTPTPTLDGATLYANNCASCHGPLATSTKLGASANLIQTGISNVSKMQFLSILTSAQIQSIAAVLQTTTPNPTPSTDGTALYASYCASCHGPIATSAKIGASVARIQTAISTISNMSSLSSLTSAQIQAISTALMAVPMPTDGPTLYAINCSSCHGALASSHVGGASVSEIQGAISEKRQMQFLSTLTLTQIQAISGALAGIRGGD